MKTTLLLILAIMALLFTQACAGNTTTTTTPPSSYPTTSTTVVATSTTVVTTTTSVPTTVAPSSTSSTVPVNFENATVFTAELSGKDVVPEVGTSATGTAVIKIDPTNIKAYFKLTLSNISDVIASRIHEGKPGSNGQGLLILYPGPTISGPFTGVIAQGYFDASALIGSLKGKTLADFAVLLRSGNAYVNVGTVENRGGEIRGQIHEETTTPATDETQ